MVEDRMEMDEIQLLDQQTVDKIAATPTDANDKPLIEQRIASVTVDTQGYTYTVVKK